MATLKRKKGKPPRIAPKTATCPSCEGKGKRPVYSGTQLRAFREHFGCGLINLAARTINPNTGRSTSISFLSNVEREIPGYPCPEWLYLAYLEIPAWSEERR